MFVLRFDDEDFQTSKELCCGSCNRQFIKLDKVLFYTENYDEVYLCVDCAVVFLDKLKDEIAVID